MSPKNMKQPKNVETFKYDDDSRTNIPTAEYQSIMEKAAASPSKSSTTSATR